MIEIKNDTENLLHALKHSSRDDLDTIEKNIKSLSFLDLLNSFYQDLNYNKADVIQQTTIDRTYAYQIFDGSKKPGRDKVIQLCLVAKCNVENTNRILTLSGNAPLYPKVKRDLYIIFCINNHYCVSETNYLLYQEEYGTL
ncbi:hypothetical protein ERUR111494_01470 [Erysipelothrix urinaevulpis]|uniref:hypothetical protein n=1 Tax=Erysipelothrix urinaevulpis TaxID=2683717 RepID=UPI001358591D|nr:hypothetical protein [Erysipelothrix urinaevulpis]